MLPGSVADWSSSRQIHFIADNRVIHSVPTAKISHGTESSGDPHAYPEGPQQSAVPPFLLQISHATLHCDCHNNTGLSILCDTLGFWVAEEQEHCITDKLVDGRAVLKGNHGHLGEVVIKNVCQLLRFQIVCGLGEACDICETDRELLPLGRDLNVLLTFKNRLINLRREIFRQLRG